MSNQNLKDIIEPRLEAKFPGFTEAWHEIVKKLGDEFVKLLKDKFTDEFQLVKEINQFKLTVVVDNNFVFGQLKNLAEKNIPLENSFIFRLSRLKLIKIFAPPKLKEELYDKIDNVLKINNEVAKQNADKILEFIEIKDAFWIDEWKKANNLIGQIDKDDVPYLALALELGTHSIISNDKIFHKSGATKVWSLQDTERVITNYNTGCISFCIIGLLSNIFEYLWSLFVSFFKIIAEILYKLLNTIIILISGTFKMIGEIPFELIALLGIIVLLSKDLRKHSSEAIDKIKEILKPLINNAMKFVNWFIEFIKDIFEILKPTGIIMFEFAGYFSFQFIELQNQIKILERERAK
jgi:predicted nucleic acid-binding protein